LKLLQFLGRENGEDYGSELLVMLNTWEAAVKFLALKKRQSALLDIARFLGWTDRKRLSPARHDPLDAHRAPLTPFGRFPAPDPLNVESQPSAFYGSGKVEKGNDAHVSRRERPGEASKSA
jgi:hypothetical protein